MGKQWKPWQTLFWGLQNHSDGDCGHEIKRHLLLGRKAMTNLDSILKSRDTNLLTKVHLVKAMVFPVVMYGCAAAAKSLQSCATLCDLIDSSPPGSSIPGILQARVLEWGAIAFSVYGCENWTIKSIECWRIDAFELWCWRRLLRVPGTARRSNQSTLKEISLEYLLEGLMLKLKLQYLGHLIRKADSLEKTLMLRKIEGRRRRKQQSIWWLDDITDSKDMNLSKLQEMNMKAWCAAKSWTQLSDLTTILSSFSSWNSNKIYTN